MICVNGLKSRDVRPEHLSRNDSGTEFKDDDVNGHRSNVVRPEHPVRKALGSSLRWARGARSNVFNPLQLHKNESGRELRSRVPWPVKASKERSDSWSATARAVSAARLREANPVHPLKNGPKTFFKFERGFISSTCSPEHPFKKEPWITVTCDSGPKSRDVRPVHPSRNESEISVRFDNGLRFNDVNLLHSSKNE